jgi:hypothetical protein
MNEIIDPFEPFLNSKTIKHLKEIKRFYVDTQQPKKELTLTDIIEFIAYEEYTRLIENSFVPHPKKNKRG